MFLLEILIRLYTIKYNRPYPLYPTIENNNHYVINKGKTRKYILGCQLVNIFIKVKGLNSQCTNKIRIFHVVHVASPIVIMTHVPKFHEIITSPNPKTYEEYLEVLEILV